MIIQGDPPYGGTISFPFYGFHLTAIYLVAFFEDTSFIAVKAEYSVVILAVEYIEYRSVSGKLGDHIIKLVIILIMYLF